MWMSSLALVKAGEFKEAKPAKIGESNAEQISTGDKLVLQLERGFLVLSFSDPRLVDKDDRETESCQIHWILVQPDQALEGKQESKIEYKVTVQDGGNRHLEAVAGSQDFSKGGVKISWSCGSPGSVYVYFKPGCHYTILKGEQSDSGTGRLRDHP